MKRFWKDAAPVGDGGGWRVELDGRPLRTPARALLLVPTERLAEQIAEEWRTSPEQVDPRAMPLTGLGNAALDRVAADKDAFAASLARYGESDLLTYRADSPAALVERQAAAWDPLLQWARRRFDVDFVVTSGVSFVPQAPNTVARLAHAVAALDPFRLAALSPLVTISGSLVAALAVLEGEVPPEEAWSAASVDEAWQLEKWGSDAEAEQALENRRQDFLAAARFLSLLD
ncbi:ATPase [Sphingomonas sp. BN140010]|uniref:ATPase n=1 Tax=Sphingomonas arvum TaxID=2992113 RepID=A0ABT3JGG1_9SPHN|nr:ATP12 family protein [Sphingomonas sp. BN140010]MCW3798155.1 ATPase [Sphingomonas sp. BN140010]